MLTKLMMVNSLQEKIIEDQAHIIDELFVFLCEHSEFDGLDPLLNSIKDVAKINSRVTEV